MLSTAAFTLTNLSSIPLTYPLITRVPCTGWQEGRPRPLGSSGDEGNGSTIFLRVHLVPEERMRQRARREGGREEKEGVTEGCVDPLTQAPGLQVCACP